MIEIYCNVCDKYRTIKIPKIYFWKTSDLPIVYSKCGHEHKKYLKKKNQLKY